MSRSLRFLDEAEEDLKRLHHLLAEKNIFAATRAIDAIYEDITFLIEHPEMGAIRNGDVDYRKWVVQFGKNGYIIEYRFDDDVFVVTRIWHSRENRN